VDFLTDSVADLAGSVRSGELAAQEVVLHALERIEELNPRLNAFVAYDGERAIREAAEIDRRVAGGEDAGPLAGIPIGVKDLEDAAGYRTTKGSAVHAGDAPASADSTLVARLRAAGCVVVGKTNTPELGWKADTDNMLFGASLNPWDIDRSPGGSSGGSAAAVAAGLVPLATASDGGGSIRIPAALCGLTGMKPSLGRIPAGGAHPPDWPLFSTRGPLARTARDTVLALDTVVGPEPSDFRSLPMPDARWLGAMSELRSPRRVGWSATLGYAPVDAEIRSVCQEAVDRLAAAGTEIVDVDPVFDEDPGRSWLLLTAAYNLRTLQHARSSELWDRVDPGLRTIVEWAASDVSAVQVIEAEDLCHRLNHRLTEVLAGVNLLLTPTVAGQTPASGAQGTIDGVADANWVRFTYPFNMTRSPAGTVTVGRTGDGMPVGLQVVGPTHGDAAVLRLLAVLEDQAGGVPAPDLAWPRG